MKTFVVLVWLPDRPGALGQVASRIGAVRGDVVGIEILERSGGQAIDELTVELPDESLTDLLVAEISAVDGVAVEDIRPAPGRPHDPRLDALEAAELLLRATTVDDLLKELTFHMTEAFSADWVAVLTQGPMDQVCVLSSIGQHPPQRWLAAFTEGSRVSSVAAADHAGPDDIAWAWLEQAGLSLVLGRQGPPFRGRERRQIASLARISDLRWPELRPHGTGQFAGG